MEGSVLQYPPGDPRMIDSIVNQLKSQGIFDQFRKECIADVDTKPAYQNLHQRVEGTVSGFLAHQIWRPDLNKNQLRESLRKHIHDSGFLDMGVERIVDQVVNPKIMTVLVPQVEDVVYKFIGVEKPKKNIDLFHMSHPPPSFQFPADSTKDIGIADLLPKDLDPVSPESNVSKKSCGSIEDGELDDKQHDDETSPPFEPLAVINDNSLGSHLSGISGLTSPDGRRSNISFVGAKTPPPQNISLGYNNDSQLSKLSSGSRMSFDSGDAKKPELPNVFSPMNVDSNDGSNSRCSFAETRGEAREKLERVHVRSDASRSSEDRGKVTTTTPDNLDSDSSSSGSSGSDSDSSDGSSSPSPEFEDVLAELNLEAKQAEELKLKEEDIVMKQAVEEEKIMKEKEKEVYQTLKKDQDEEKPVLKKEKDVKKIVHEDTKLSKDKECEKSLKKDSDEKKVSRNESEVKLAKKEKDSDKYSHKDKKEVKVSSKEVKEKKDVDLSKKSETSKEGDRIQTHDKSEKSVKREDKDKRSTRDEKLTKKDDKPVKKDGKERTSSKNTETVKSDLDSNGQESKRKESSSHSGHKSDKDKSRRHDDAPKSGKSEKNVSSKDDKAKKDEKSDKHKTSVKHKVDERSKGDTKLKSDVKYKDEKQKSSDKHRSDSKHKSDDKSKVDDKHKSKNGKVDKEKSSKIDEKSSKDKDRKVKEKDSSTKSETDKRDKEKKDSKSKSSGDAKTKDSAKKKEKGKRTDDHDKHREKRSEDRRSTDRDSNGTTRDPSAGSSRKPTSGTQDAQRHESKEGKKGGKSGGSGNTESADTPSGSKQDAASCLSPSVKSPLKKRPQEKQSDPDEQYFCSSNDGKLTLKVKKPKIADNIFEVQKIIRLRKSLAKLEQKRQRELTEVQMRSEEDDSRYRSDEDLEDLKYFESFDEKKGLDFVAFVKRLGESRRLSEIDASSVESIDLDNISDSELPDTNYEYSNDLRCPIPSIEYIPYDDMHRPTSASAVKTEETTSKRTLGAEDATQNALKLKTEPKPKKPETPYLKRKSKMKVLPVDNADLTISDTVNNLLPGKPVVLESDVSVSDTPKSLYDTKVGGVKTEDLNSSYAEMKPPEVSPSSAEKRENKRARKPNTKYSSADYSFVSEEVDPDDDPTVKSIFGSVKKRVGNFLSKLTTVKRQRLANPEPKEIVDDLGRNNNEDENVDGNVVTKPDVKAVTARRIGLSRPTKIARVSTPPNLDFIMPLSPESDVSASSSEQAKKSLPEASPSEEEAAAPLVDGLVKQGLRRGGVPTKGQRYTSEDLYKPRPLFNRVTRRKRGSSPLPSDADSHTVNGIGSHPAAAASEPTPIQTSRKQR